MTPYFKGFVTAVALALLLFFAFAPKPAQGVEVNGNTITLSAEEAAACEAEGGCAVFGRKHVVELMQAVARRAYATGRAEGARDCPGRRSDVEYR